MFRVTYINQDNEICSKSGFNQVSEAMKWVKKQGDNIIPLKLLVWNDYIDACSTIWEL